MSWSPTIHPPGNVTHTTPPPPLLELSLDPPAKTKHSGDAAYHKEHSQGTTVSHLCWCTSASPPRSLWSWKGSSWCQLSADARMVRFLHELSRKICPSLPFGCTAFRINPRSRGTQSASWGRNSNRKKRINLFAESWLVSVLLGYDLSGTEMKVCFIGDEKKCLNLSFQKKKKKKNPCFSWRKQTCPHA